MFELEREGHWQETRRTPRGQVAFGLTGPHDTLWSLHVYHAREGWAAQWTVTSTCGRAVLASGCLDNHGQGYPSAALARQDAEVAIRRFVGRVRRNVGPEGVAYIHNGGCYIPACPTCDGRRYTLAVCPDCRTSGPGEDTDGETEHTEHTEHTERITEPGA